jgi:hypothetical protein
MVFAADSQIILNTNDLPYQTDLSLDITGEINQTLNITYDTWLSGQNSITFTDPLYTLGVHVSIPTGTAAGNYTRTVILTDGQTPLIKTIAITINPSADADHDGYPIPIDCNDNEPTINPGKPEILYNGKDDDCNDQTPDDPPFTAALSSIQINIGEPLRIALNAPNSSNITIEVCMQGQGFVPCYTALQIRGQSFPASISIPYVNTSGQYTITATMKYGSITRTQESAFTIRNSLTAIVEGERSVDVNKELVLAAFATGGIPPYTYSWTIPEKSAVSGPLVNTTYTSTGERTVVLTIKDNAKNDYNTTMIVNILRLYPVRVTVLDDATQNRMSNVKVSARDTTLTTDPAGEATFQLSQDSYTFAAFTEGYEPYSVRYRIERETNITLKLIKRDSTAPAVILTSPINPSTVNSGMQGFTFSYMDASPGTCDLVMGEGNFYLVKNTVKVAASPASATATTITIAITPGTFQWKVECKDSRGNKGTSGTFTITVLNTTNSTLPQPTTDTTTTTNPTAASTQPPALSSGQRPNLLDGFYAALDTAAAFSLKEQEAAAAIGFEKNINQALKTFDQVNRDINDLPTRRDLNEQQKLERNKELTQKLDSLFTTIPISLKVTEDKKFVKYATDPELEAFAKVQYPDVKSDIAVPYLKNLQNKVMVSVQAMHITMSYLDGRTQDYTLIIKTLDKKNLSKEDALIEVIPAGIANQNEITFVTPASKTKEEQYTFADVSTPKVYLIGRVIPFTTTEQLLTIIATPAVPQGMIEGTGHAVFSIDTQFDLKTVLIIIILAGICAYILYTTEALEKVKEHLHSGKPREKDVRMLIHSCLDHLNENDHENANLILEEIKLMYDTLPEQEKNGVFDDVTQLCCQLDISFIRETIGQSQALLEQGSIDEAVQTYQRIQGVFDTLSPEQQEALYDEIIVLHNTILHHSQ